VIRTGPAEYDLLVSSDWNSLRHRQWFYFRVQGMVSAVAYKLNIVNYDKPDSVFNRGCKPTLFSAKRFRETGVGWTRANAQNSNYYCNAFRNDYEPKIAEIRPCAVAQSPKTLEKKPAFSNFRTEQSLSLSTGQSSGQSSDIDDDANDSVAEEESSSAKRVRKKKQRKKHKNHGRLAAHGDCLSENNASISASVSPSQPAHAQSVSLAKVQRSKAASSSSSSTSISSSSRQSSREQSPQPITRLNYKQIRKRRARMRHKTRAHRDRETAQSAAAVQTDSNYTNVLRRNDNGMSFDILLSSKKTSNPKRKIGSEEQSPSPHVHTIPSVNSSSSEKKTAAPTQSQWSKEEDKKYHYTLSFTVRFPYAGDTAFVSYFYPFSYSDLQGWLNILTISRRLNVLRRQLLCRSRMGNRVDLLTITNLSSAVSSIRERPVVVLSGRVHPGEVNASWVIKGAVDFLVSSNGVAAELRNRFVFKVVPCLNPDGVICGNHRCSLSGVDLNRQYLAPSHVYHPSIFHLKALVAALSADVQRPRGVFCVCDAHGHSRMMNVTLYGCAPDADHKHFGRARKSSLAQTAAAKVKMAAMDAMVPNGNAHFKLLPMLLALRAPNLFSMEQCVWTFSKQKEGTARVVFWRQFNIQNAFTMESSFCGATMGSLKGFHFNVEHYLQMGAKFVAALYDVAADTNEAKVRLANAVKQLKAMVGNNDEEGTNNGSSSSTKKMRSRKARRVK